MIQIYEKGNENFEGNGDRVITPVSCELTMELNGSWEMELVHPVDDNGEFRFVREENIICAPTPAGARQLFKIYSVVKTDDSVTAYARPVFLDAAQEVFVLNGKVKAKNGQQVLDLLTEGTKYSGSSDIRETADADFTHQNLIEAVNGDKEDSFLNRWGGEVLYDNYWIIVNKRIGKDNGIRAEFGHNLTGIEEEIDLDKVVTRIFPVAYNGYTLDAVSPYVDSPLLNRYAHPYVKKVSFEDVKLKEDASGEEGFANIRELRQELIRRCEQMFEEGIDKPVCNYKVNMVDLSLTEEYRDYAPLEAVGLGDTVYCRHRRLGIETKARVIKVRYDCILQQNIEEELGDFSYNYFSKMAFAADKINLVIKDGSGLQAEKVRGVLSDGAGKSYWKLDSGEMELNGNFTLSDPNTKNKSVAMSENALNLYDWKRQGKYAGCVSALQCPGVESGGFLHDGRSAMMVSGEEGVPLILGAVSAGGGTVRASIVLDKNRQTPFIAGGANGTVKLPGGGEIRIENGLVTGWNIPQEDGKLNAPDSVNSEIIIESEADSE